jgi:hypothetical protein
MRKTTCAFVVSLAAGTGSAFAQAPNVQFSGVATPGDCTKIVSSQFITDAGALCGTPPGGSPNSIQYNNSGAFGGLSIVNNAIVVTNGSGVPSESTTLPNGIGLGAATATTINNVTIPNTTATALTTAGAKIQLVPTSPTGTSSTGSYKMMGLGSACAITPLYSTRMYVAFTGWGSNNTNSGGWSVLFAYGTGSAPGNGASATGSTATSQVQSQLASGAGSGNSVPFSQIAVLTGLTPSTNYWLDLQLESLGGGLVTIQSLTCTAFEM